MLHFARFFNILCTRKGNFGYIPICLCTRKSDFGYIPVYLCTRKGDFGYIYLTGETDSIISTFLSAIGNWWFMNNSIKRTFI